MNAMRLLLGACLATAPLSAWAQPSAPPPTELFLTGLNVSNLDRSIDFYTRVLGLAEYKRYGDVSGQVQVLLGTPGQAPARSVLVLVWRKDHNGPYQLGTAFSRIGVRTPDAQALVGRVKAAGYKVTHEPARASQTSPVLAFVTDPDGYPVEVIQEPAP